MQQRAFVFAGGGTGGHLYPGIAVAEALRRREPDARIVFIGSGRQVERGILESAGVESVALKATPLSDAGRFPIRFLKTTCEDFRTARYELERYSVAVVIGLGGIASLSTIRAAGRKRVPVVLLEQNAIPGRATRWFAKRYPVCLSYKESAARLKTKQHLPVTGNPVRDSIASLATAAVDSVADRKTLLVLGGSQGSQQVNRAMIAAADELSVQLSGWHIMHQAGPTEAGTVTDAYTRLKASHEVEPFFRDLPERYRVANLAVTRAGATTLAELACAGIPAILLPYPQAKDDHQRANASVFHSAEAAVTIDTTADDTVVANEVTRKLRWLTGAPGKRDLMSKAMRKVAVPDAADRVVDFILETVKSASFSD